jgi:hypothetical protein
MAQNAPYPSATALHPLTSPVRGIMAGIPQHAAYSLPLNVQLIRQVKQFLRLESNRRINSEYTPVELWSGPGITPVILPFPPTVPAIAILPLSLPASPRTTRVRIRISKCTRPHNPPQTLEFNLPQRRCKVPLPDEYIHYESALSSQVSSGARVEAMTPMISSRNVDANAS